MDKIHDSFINLKIHNLFKGYFIKYKHQYYLKTFAMEAPKASGYIQIHGVTFKKEMPAKLRKIINTRMVSFVLKQKVWRIGMTILNTKNKNIGFCPSCFQRHAKH